MEVYFYMFYRKKRKEWPQGDHKRLKASFYTYKNAFSFAVTYFNDKKLGLSNLKFLALASEPTKDPRSKYFKVSQNSLWDILHKDALPNSCSSQC